MNKKILSAVISLFILISVLLAYQNLYDNEFHFDDSHTITENPYIKEISNLPKFFTLGSVTFSSLPANQVYRPIVTSSIAIDYWLSAHFSDTQNGFEMPMYHYSMMLTFLLLLALLFAFFYKLFHQARPHKWNIYFAFFATAFFGLHTVNAETINYIISRSDLISTFFVVAAFDVFLYFPKHRKWGVFLVPYALGVLTKLTAAMFIPMLLVYYFVFEWIPMTKTQRKANIKKILIYAFTLLAILGVSVVFVMSMQSDTFVPSNFSRWDYLISMPFVILHYFISFFVPYNLSADSDWTILSSIFDIRFFVGMTFLAAIGFVFIKYFRDLKYAPITFGLLWFLIALAPTSSLIPLAEVMNDHRMFYPFVGLMLAVIYYLSIILVKYQENLRRNKLAQALVFSVVFLVLGGHFCGTYQRTEVWDSGKSLWYDVTIKSPKNGRGLMNYGLRLMSAGDYQGAMEYYKKAQEFSPKYSYLHTNMGVCYNAMGQKDEAEKSFKLALQYAYYSHKPHYYYGNYLMGLKRYQEAETEFNLSLQMAPKYIYSWYKLMELYAATEDWEKLKFIIQQTQADFPNDVTASYYTDIASGKMSKLDLARKQSVESPSAATFLELSLQFYFVQNYDSSAWAAKQVLGFDPNSITAYNNICAANNVLGNWNEAINAGEQALKLNPDNQLAKNNLAVSYLRKDFQIQLETLQDADQLIELSLKFYKEEMYNDCIKACEKSLKYKSNNSIAYNNICSSYNAMKQWQKAVEAGTLAVKYAPDYQLAKNNLAYSLRMLEQEK